MQFTDFHFNLENPDKILPKPDKGSKWRRRVADRRTQATERLLESNGFVEKRTSGDRRRHILERVSKVIFPRGKDGYGY